MGPHATPPSHIILTPGRPVMFYDSHFFLTPIQAGTTTTFNIFSITLVNQSGIKPISQCWVPPIVAFYRKQGLLKADWPQSGAGTPNPPKGKAIQKLPVTLYFLTSIHEVNNSFSVTLMSLLILYFRLYLS